VPDHADENRPKGKIKYGVKDLSTEALSSFNEQAVPESFWTLEWRPSPECQVVLYTVASLGTWLYQKYVSYKIDRERYQEWLDRDPGPHRRSSEYRPFDEDLQDMYELSDEDEGQSPLMKAEASERGEVKRKSLRVSTATRNSMRLDQLDEGNSPLMKSESAGREKVKRKSMRLSTAASSRG